MVGICGYTGDPSQVPVLDNLGTIDQRSREYFELDEVKIDLITHPFYKNNSIFETDDNLVFSLWGEVYGYEDKQGYHSLNNIERDIAGVEICAKLHSIFGREFPTYINGDYCGVIFNAEDNEVSLFTDLLGSRPIYYIQNDGLTFSTSLYSIAHIPDGVNQDRVSEYLLFGRVLGTRTPFTGLESLSPATVATFDAQNGDLLDEFVYWTPSYSPSGKSYEEYLNEFIEIFSDAVEERTEGDFDTGLLLSGGSDSRVVLSATDAISNSIHINDSLNEEALVSKEVAEKYECDFTFVNRSPDHYPSFLEEEIHLSNFNGAFTAAHTTGLGQKLRNEVDVLMAGHWSDTLFEAYVPRWTVKLPIINQSIDIPVNSNIDLETDIIDLFTYSRHGLLGKDYGDTFRKVEIDKPVVTETDHNPKSIVRQGLSSTSDGIQFYNVEFENHRDLVLFGYFYPLTNAWSYISHGLTLQQIPYRNPFLDTRIIKFATRLPIRYRLRKDLIDDAIMKLDASLGNIRSSNNGLTLNHSFYYKYIYNYVFESHSLLKNVITNKPEESRDRGSWPNHSAILRESSYAEEIVQNSQVVDEHQYISREAFYDLYRTHLDGEDLTHAIHACLTLFSHPALVGQSPDSNTDEP